MPIAHHVRFGITLNYNSRDDFLGSFGYNVSSILDDGLTEDPGTGNVTHHDETGASHLCTKSGSAYIHPPGIYNILSMVNGTWQATFSYDYEGRMTSANIPGYPALAVAHDGVGRKLKETSGGVETKFVYDSSQPAQERDASNNLNKEYFWDGGRLFKQGAGANARFPETQVSGTPERWTDTGGQYTGGSLYSRSGEKVLAYNDSELKIGWGGERKSGNLPVWGAYSPALGRPFSGPSTGFQLIPSLGIPTAAYQGLLGTNNPPIIPAIAHELLRSSNATVGPFSGVSVDNDWRMGLGGGGKPAPTPAGFTICCLRKDTEGEVDIQVGEGAPSIICPKGQQFTAPTPSKVHLKQGECVGADADGNGGWTYRTVTNSVCHCDNARNCCPVTGKCGDCAVSGCWSGPGPGGTKWDEEDLKKCCAKAGPGDGKKGGGSCRCGAGAGASGGDGPPVTPECLTNAQPNGCPCYGNYCGVQNVWPGDKHPVDQPRGFCATAPVRSEVDRCCCWHDACGAKWEKEQSPAFTPRQGWICCSLWCRAKRHGFSGDWYFSPDYEWCNLIANVTAKCDSLCPCNDALCDCLAGAGCGADPRCAAAKELMREAIC